MIWLRIVWYVFWSGLCWGALEGILIGTLLWPVVGTMFGLPIGALVGGIVGAINGLILAKIISRMYHNTNTNQINRRFIHRVYVWANVIFTFLVLGALGLISAVKPLGSQVPNILIFGGSIPAFIEGGRAIYCSGKFINFVATQLSNLPSRNAPPNVLS